LEREGRKTVSGEGEGLCAGRLKGEACVRRLRKKKIKREGFGAVFGSVLLLAKGRGDGGTGWWFRSAVVGNTKSKAWGGFGVDGEVVWFVAAYAGEMLESRKWQGLWEKKNSSRGKGGRPAW
jgi:hypothetical protein